MLSLFANPFVKIALVLVIAVFAGLAIFRDDAPQPAIRKGAPLKYTLRSWWAGLRQRAKAWLAKVEANMVDDWRECLRWSSMHAYVALGALIGAWREVPDDVKAALPKATFTCVALAIIGYGVVGRMRKQARKLPQPDDTDQAGA